MNKRIRFGIYQSCGNRGSVVCVFGLQMWGWCRRAVDSGLGPGSGRVVLCLREFGSRVLCVDGRSRYLYMYMYLRCTRCPIFLHLIDICVLPCICLWQIFVCVLLLDLDVSRDHLSLSGAAPVIQRVRMAGLHT